MMAQIKESQSQWEELDNHLLINMDFEDFQEAALTAKQLEWGKENAK